MGDGKLCKLISEGNNIATANEQELDDFQHLVASAQAFENASLIRNLRGESPGFDRSKVSIVTWDMDADLAFSPKPTNRRWLILRFLAAKARWDKSSQAFALRDVDFSGLAGTQADIDKACQWLADRGLISWVPLVTGQGGAAWIEDAGHDAIEAGPGALSTFDKQPQINHHVDNSNHVYSGTFNTTGDAAIGANATLNKQVLADEVAKLIQAIKEADTTDAEKADALGLLKGALEHPLVTTIVGGVLGGLLA